MSELIQDFKRRVGMKSKEQLASEEERMMDRTSAGVAGRNVDRGGGAVGGGECGETSISGARLRVVHSLVILSPKKLRKDEASWEGSVNVGRQVGGLRESKESRADQSFLG